MGKAGIGPRLGLRGLIELVGLAGIGLGAWRLAEQARPPGPETRALVAGDEAEKVAALRSLALMGPEGLDAIPALVVAAREDRSAVVRRGAAHTLMALAIEQAAIELPVDAALAGPASAGGTGRPVRPPPRRSLPFLRPRCDEAAAHLAEVMRTDPDPGVRVYALRCLRKILEAADEERQFARAALKPGQPPAEHPGSGPWVESAARAIANRTRDPDPEVAGHAIGFLVGGSTEGLLADSERLDALLAPIEAGAGAGGRPLPPGVELLALNGAVRRIGPDHPEAPRLVAPLVRLVESPPTPVPGPDGPGLTEEARQREALREGAARILWHLIGSVDDLRGRPGVAEVLVPMLSQDWHERRRGEGFRSADWLNLSNVRLASRHYERRLTSTMGGAPDLPTLSTSVSRAFVRDPRMIGLVWPRMDRQGRLNWLTGFHWRMRFSGDPTWDQILSLLADPGIRPDLTPEACEAVLAAQLDEAEAASDPLATNFERKEVEERRRRAKGSTFATPPADAALELRRFRELAVLSYFARGATPGAEEVDRLVDRLRGLLNSEDVSTRQWTAALLGSLGPAVQSAAGDLGAMASDDPDEATRGAAAAALVQIQADPEGAR